MEQLDASVVSTVFRNEENAYTVLSVRTGRREVTVVGHLPMLSPGEQVLFSGEWIESKKYGRQFQCSAYQIRKPDSLLGLERYLGSGLIRGVGPSTAKKLVDHFGMDILEVLSEYPERLREVSGFGGKRWKQVAESFRKQTVERDAMVFLQSYGVPAGLAAKIARFYGEDTRDVLQHNPYRLCSDVEGVGFLTADRIGAALGIARDSDYRVQAALRYTLQDAAASNGHVYLPLPELEQRASQLLQVDPALCRRQVDGLTLRREIVRRLGPDGVERVYLPAFAQAEAEVASQLCQLAAARCGQVAGQLDEAIDQFELLQNIRFSPRQREAIRSAVIHGVLVITGGPGTGKTTIINCALHLLAGGGETLLCAPTGRAAKRMGEACGREAKTIHRLLEFGGEDGMFARGTENPLECSCVIVDEMSMVDLMLMRSLLRALKPGTRLILVGDSDQLPSVGAGNVLGDILASGVVPAVRLTDIFRQSEQSRIVVNAHRINHGELPLMNEPGTDFFFQRCEAPAQAAREVVQLVTARLAGYLKLSDAERVRQIQVLSPTRKGDCGVVALNQLLQDALNPARPKLSLRHGETEFRLGDKVMQTHNDYQLAWRRTGAGGEEEGCGVFNGDIGFVTDVNPEEHSLTVRFDDERDAEYDNASLENLDLAYCLSVHKSQGSEYPVVVMPVVGGPPMLLTRNLFYTALTRAKQLVMLLGRDSVIAQMVRNDHVLKRYTALAEQLQATAAALGLPRTE